MPLQFDTSFVMYPFTKLTAVRTHLHFKNASYARAARQGRRQ